MFMAMCLNHTIIEEFVRQFSRSHHTAQFIQFMITPVWQMYRK